MISKIKGASGPSSPVSLIAILPLLVAATLPYLFNVHVQCVRSAADSYPLVVEDGDDSFLILDDDEVTANSQLLKHLSAASKEEVEEIVDSNPQMQDMILNRIKSAVDKRKKGQSSLKIRKPANPAMIKPYFDDKKLAKPKKQPYDEYEKKPYPKKAKGFEPDKSSESANDYEDNRIRDNDDDDDSGEGEEDDELGLDEKRIESWRSKLRGKAAKMFKIGSGFKEKILKHSRKKGNKKASKSPRWPHFHYKISTN